MTKKEKELLFNEYCRVNDKVETSFTRYSMFLSKFDDGHEPNDLECEHMDLLSTMYSDWNLKFMELINVIKLLGCDIEAFSEEFYKKYEGGCVCE